MAKKKKINKTAIGGVLRLKADLAASGTGLRKLDLVQEYADSLGCDEDHEPGTNPHSHASNAAHDAVAFLEGKVGNGTIAKAKDFADVLKPVKK